MNKLTVDPIINLVFELYRAVRADRKALRKQTMKYNRIRNVTPGLARIYILDDIATDYEVHAEAATEDVDKEVCEKYALFLRRLEWDLVELNIAVWDRRARDGSKYDPLNWRGPRP